MAPEFGFAGKPGESRMSPGRVHHAERLKVAAVRVYDLPVTLKLKPRHFSREEFRAEILSWRVMSEVSFSPFVFTIPG